MILGYARVSTADQQLDSQLDALSTAGAERIFADTITGTARTRPELDQLMRQLRPGDVVVVTKYDQLARSLKDLLDIVEQIKAQGCRLPIPGRGRHHHPGRPPGLSCLCLDRPVRARADRRVHQGRFGSRAAPGSDRRPASCPVPRPEDRGQAHAGRGAALLCRRSPPCSRSAPRPSLA